MDPNEPLRIVDMDATGGHLTALTSKTDRNPIQIFTYSDEVLNVSEFDHEEITFAETYEPHNIPTEWR